MCGTDFVKLWVALGALRINLKSARDRFETHVNWIRNRIEIDSGFVWSGCWFDSGSLRLHFEFDLWFGVALI